MKRIFKYPKRVFSRARLKMLIRSLFGFAMKLREENVREKREKARLRSRNLRKRDRSKKSFIRPIHRSSSLRNTASFFSVVFISLFLSPCLSVPFVLSCSSVCGRACIQDHRESCDDWRKSIQFHRISNSII